MASASCSARTMETGAGERAWENGAAQSTKAASKARTRADRRMYTDNSSENAVPRSLHTLWLIDNKKGRSELRPFFKFDVLRTLKVHVAHAAAAAMAVTAAACCGLGRTIGDHRFGGDQKRRHRCRIL